MVFDGAWNIAEDITKKTYSIIKDVMVVNHCSAKTNLKDDSS